MCVQMLTVPDILDIGGRDEDLNQYDCFTVLMGHRKMEKNRSKMENNC